MSKNVSQKWALTYYIKLRVSISHLAAPTFAWHELIYGCSYFWMMIFDEQEEGEPNDDDTKIQLYNT